MGAKRAFNNAGKKKCPTHEGFAPFLGGFGLRIKPQEVEKGTMVELTIKGNQSE